MYKNIKKNVDYKITSKAKCKIFKAAKMYSIEAILSFRETLLQTI